MENDRYPKFGIGWIIFLAIPAFCVATIVIGRMYWEQAIWDQKPEPWYECALQFTDGNRVVLMRRSLAGITKEYGLQVRVELFNGMSNTISAYTESERTDVFTSTGVFRDGRRVPLLRLETDMSTYQVDMSTLEELPYPSVEDEDQRTFLGYFDGVQEFIPSVPHVSMIPDSCGVLSPQP